MARKPVSILYCVAANCPYRTDRLCTKRACVRVGCEKRALYFVEHGHLADGDIPDA